MNGHGDDLLFAPDAQKLLREGRVEEAITLGQTGVAAHPHYSTGHMVLGIAYLSARQYEEARLELEKALKLDGPGPALLDSLAVCYDGLGLIDRAEECRILGEGHDLEPLRDEYEGGPEMDEERDDSLDPGDGELEQNAEFGSSFDIGDDAGSPEDALKELEALLVGAGSSLEGETIEEETPAGDDLPVEEEPPVEDDAPQDAESPAEDDKSDMWKQIMEQAEAAEQSDEPAEEVPVVEDAGVIDLDAGPAEDVPVGEDAGVIDLDAGPAEEVPVVEDAAAIDLDSTLSLDGVQDLDASVEMVEGLEISAPGGETVDAEEVEDPDDTGDYSTDQEDAASVGGGEDLVVGPLEISDEVMDAASEGIELDSSFEVTPAGDDTEDEAASDEDPAEVHDLLDEEADELDVDEALKALETELDAGSDTDAAAGSPLEDDLPPPDEAPAEITLDDDDADTLDLDLALADLENGDDIEAVAPDEAVPEEEADEAPPVDPAVATAGIPVKITSADDSIEIAIQADLLVGKGQYKDAVRLFEALQLWEPDRESYRIRLEELRRMAEQPEQPE